ncbi:MAG: ABC transporter ATP-binding protein [Candidatus Magasanikbacteria bacterium]|nr:ABC transporter ATP-binding protein [Candidatus Magasanikbacteria bacterium]
MNYKLNSTDTTAKKGVLKTAFTRLLPLMAEEKSKSLSALGAIVITSISTLFAPVIIGHTIDTYIAQKNFHGVLMSAALLLGLYLIALYTSYYQTKTMGGVGRRVLFNLRNVLFNKLQSLPVAFFNENKAGDLISRINNDTDKLNQFFAQALMQFFGSALLIVGSGIFLLVLNGRLGIVSLLPAIVVIIVTQLVSPWVKRKNLISLQSIGGMSAEIQQSLENFKVIVVFNRLDYFRNKFNETNEKNYKASVGAGVANNLFTPLYGLAFNLAQVLVLGYGILLIHSGSLTIGLLIGFILYVNNFYNPLRQLASVWSSLQQALAGLDRISEVLALESNMKILPAASEGTSGLLLEFKDVSFGYPGGREVLHHVNLQLKPGHTYALVGPTGGGKTTTASMMARLYDPTAGTVFLEGRDIRSYEASQRAQKIGFILQEPFLFTGTVRENIIYGNDLYKNFSNDQLKATIDSAGLQTLLTRFDAGLETKVAANGGTLSLGQKQLIAFIRAVLRNPDLLILDEATANIDTVTEQLLEDILKNLPAKTTKVIIAHRLNTIENAGEIFFVNAGEIVPAGSMEHAVDMLLHGQRKS